MRLLIFTPTWIDRELGVDAIHPGCAASIRAAMSADMEWIIGRENPYPIGDHRNVLHQYQQARAMCLEGDYDALLTVEHDNRLPGAIERMLATDADVVYAPYLLRHGRPLLNTWQWINDREMGMSLSNYPDELARARAAGVWKISGTGMGCTLFRRRALELIEITASSDNNPCPDLGFARAALRAGLVSVGRFDVPVAHYSRGRWRLPFEEQDMKYKVLESGQAMADGRIFRLKAGSEIELNAFEAEELGRLGRVEAVVDGSAGCADEPPILQPVVEAAPPPLELIVEDAPPPSPSRRKRGK